MKKTHLIRHGEKMLVLEYFFTVKTIIRQSKTECLEKIPPRISNNYVKIDDILITICQLLMQPEGRHFLDNES